MEETGSDPDYVEPAAIAQLLLEETHIIRPTLPALFFMSDISLRTMLRGFRVPVPGKKGTMRTVVNSREEKLDGRTWSKSFRERRCLISLL